jgi:A/G-specific adenine glycosylase
VESKNSLKLPVTAEEFASQLLDWYRQNKRDLPWRNNSDPYRVWVSEVMLQQTQVKTALPHFDKFLSTYPTLQALARAEENQVLSCWSGLGYYSRARNLHKAAQIVCENHEGAFPREYKKALRLPGIGRSTAGAILSIAYAEPLPVVDGNIRRLFVRYLKIEEEREQQSVEKLWQLLNQIVKESPIAENIAEFNQALMEIGSLVCTPRNPHCSSCPLTHSCIARQQGLQAFLPRPRTRRRTCRLHYTVALVARNGEYLLRKTSSDSFLKGFWEFPRVAGRPSKRSVNNFKEVHSLDLKVERKVAAVTHQITFRQMNFHPLLASLRGRAPEKDFSWVALDNSNYPLPSYVKKIVKNLE